MILLYVVGGRTFQIAKTVADAQSQAVTSSNNSNRDHAAVVTYGDDGGNSHQLAGDSLAQGEHIHDATNANAIKGSKNSGSFYRDLLSGFSRKG